MGMRSTLSDPAEANLTSSCWFRFPLPVDSRCAAKARNCAREIGAPHKCDFSQKISSI
jgi:hypothetical protein